MDRWSDSSITSNWLIGKSTSWCVRHIGFQIPYIYNGVVFKYYPDFIIRLKTGDLLVIETKGKETEKDRTKRNFLEEWVKAVNAHGGFGRWKWAVSRNPADVAGIISESIET